MLYINLAGNIVIDLYSILIVTVIYAHSRKHSEAESFQNRVYSWLLLVTGILLVFDIMSRFDGNPGTWYAVVNYAGNLLAFLTNLILPSLWILYVNYQVTQNEKKTRKLSAYLIAVNLANMAAVLVSLPYGWLYYIDKGNIYHRGSLYSVSAAVLILMMLYAFFFILVNREKIEQKYYFSLLFFAVPPFLCIFLQILIYGSSLMLSSVVLSLLIIYFNIQNRYLNTDYLTGVSNRKKLEAHLQEKIAASTESNSFSAILIDMDNFKSINDNFGHDMGDDALSTFVQLLKSSLRSDDFIARFGGDEFYIVLGVSDRDVLETTVTRIKDGIRKFNESKQKPYGLEFSVGYAVYDAASHMKMDEFQKQLDMLMYVDKKLAKENLDRKP